MLVWKKLNGLSGQPHTIIPKTNRQDEPGLVGLARWLSDKKIHLLMQETWVQSLRRSPGGGNGNSFQDSCLRKSHGQMSLMGYSTWGSKELDMTERVRALAQWQPTALFLPGEFHGQRSLEGYSP